MTHVPTKLNPSSPSPVVEDPKIAKWHEDRQKALEILNAPNPQFADSLAAERIRNAQASIKAARRMGYDQAGIRSDGEAYTKAFDAMVAAKAAFELASNELIRHEQIVEEILTEQKAAVEAEALAAELDKKSGLNSVPTVVVKPLSPAQLERDAAQGINKPTAAELAANPSNK